MGHFASHSGSSAGLSENHSAMEGGVHNYPLNYNVNSSKEFLDLATHPRMTNSGAGPRVCTPREFTSC